MVHARRRLDQELLRRGLCADLDAATELIVSGRVRVGGAPALEAARQVGPDESISLAEAQTRFVSRGGEKLDGALAATDCTVAGRRVLDAGASTGGFTDCLLQRGAAQVIAVDVGHGLLAWSLQQDPRVTVLDRTNVRTLTAAIIGGPVDVIVADLSFIGLRTVAPALLACAAPDAQFLLLVKPQFEAPKSDVGVGGIVRDPEARRAVLQRVVRDLAAAGIATQRVLRSPITGTSGNIEYFVVGMPGTTPVDHEEIDALIKEEL